MRGTLGQARDPGRLLHGSDVRVYCSDVKATVLSSLSLRALILGALLSVGMSLAFYWTLSTYLTQQARLDQIRSFQFSFSTQLAHLREWFLERTREVVLLSRNPIIRSGQLDQIHDFLARHLPHQQGPFLLYFASDSLGNYTNSLIRRPGSLAHRSYFDSVRNGQVVISGFEYSLTTGLPIISFVAPILNDAFEFQGAFGLSIDLLNLGPYFRQRLVLHSDTDLLLVDGQGRILWGSRWSFQGGGSLTQPSEFLPPHLTDLASIILHSPRGEWEREGHYVIQEMIEGTPSFHLIQSSSLANLTQAINQLQVQVGLLSLALSMILLASIAGINFLWRRNLDRLRSIFDRVAQGDFSVIAPESGDREMGQTSHSFNQMMNYVRRLVFYDSVTGLPNRSYFDDFVKNALRDPQFHTTSCALVVLSIDKFKNFNDIHGSTVGDQLLRMVGKRLIRILPKGAMVGRGNGAEFNIFLYNHPNRGSILDAVRSILHDSETPHQILEEKFYLTFSIGIAFYPQDATNYDELMINASIAKNSAKKGGGNQLKTFNDSMKLGLNRQLQIEAHLHIALEYNQFHLVYQPQVDSRTRQIVGMEALIRWVSPDLGPISPGIFIPIAEESGLIKAIDRWCLYEAMRQNHEWLQQGCLPVPVSVNISSIQLEQPEFLEELNHILKLTRLPPNLLELEITERVALAAHSDVLERLKAIRDMGVKICIDDFGTGYSSLNYLTSLPVHRIKIDQSFIRELPSNSQTAGVVDTILHMARTFHLEVVAEGVETPQQLDFLEKHGCLLVQGFYFSHPLSREEMRTSLIRGKIVPKEQLV